jgi:hypothetical protein
MFICKCFGLNSYSPSEKKKNIRKEIDEFLHFNSGNASSEIRNLVMKSMSNDETVYHNRNHVIEVENFAKEILHTLNFSPTTNVYIAVVYACRLHDVYHPASNTNKYEFNGEVFEELESFHMTITKFILSKIDTLLSDEYICFIGELILATNLRTYDTKKTTVLEKMKCVIRCADLGHFTYDFENHMKHFTRLNNEMGGGIDQNSNISFIDRFVLPQFELLHEIFPCDLFQSYLDQIKRNRSYWELASYI